MFDLMVGGIFVDVLIARVKRGAALLDRFDPGWHRRIESDRLAMETSDRCILGMLHGDFTRGFRAILQTLPSTQLVSAAAHGFTLYDDEQRITWKAGGPDLSELVYEAEPGVMSRFDALAEIWRREVRAREKSDG